MPFPARTLAFSVGPRVLGWAAFEESELRAHSIADLRARTGHRNLERSVLLLMRELAVRFDPHMVALVQTRYRGSRRADRAQVVESAICHGASSMGLPIRRYTPAMVRSAVTKDAKAPRRKLVEVLARDWYPWLERNVRRPEIGKRYWDWMFDAIAVGLTAYQDVFRKRVLRAMGR